MDKTGICSNRSRPIDVIWYRYCFNCICIILEIWFWFQLWGFCRNTWILGDEYFFFSMTLICLKLRTIPVILRTSACSQIPYLLISLTQVCNREKLVWHREDLDSPACHIFHRLQIKTLQWPVHITRRPERKTSMSPWCYVICDMSIVLTST